MQTGERKRPTAPVRFGQRCAASRAGVLWRAKLTVCWMDGTVLSKAPECTTIMQRAISRTAGRGLQPQLREKGTFKLGALTVPLHCDRVWSSPRTEHCRQIVSLDCAPRCRRRAGSKGFQRPLPMSGKVGAAAGVPAGEPGRPPHMQFGPATNLGTALPRPRLPCIRRGAAECRGRTCRA